MFTLQKIKDPTRCYVSAP